MFNTITVTVQQYNDVRDYWNVMWSTSVQGYFAHIVCTQVCAKIVRHQLAWYQCARQHCSTIMCTKSYTRSSSKHNVWTDMNISKQQIYSIMQNSRYIHSRNFHLLLPGIKSHQKRTRKHLQLNIDQLSLQNLLKIDLTMKYKIEMSYHVCLCASLKVHQVYITQFV